MVEFFKKFLYLIIICPLGIGGLSNWAYWSNLVIGGIYPGKRLKGEVTPFGPTPTHTQEEEVGQNVKISEKMVECFLKNGRIF